MIASALIGAHRQPHRF